MVFTIDKWFHAIPMGPKARIRQLTEILLQFRKEVWVDSTVHKEVLTLMEGLLMAAVSLWAWSHAFVFESNSKFIVA